MSIKTIATIILTTLGIILAGMAGHDMFLPNADAWLAGIKGTTLTMIFIAGVVCLVAVLVIHIVTGYNFHVISSYKPKKQAQEYYGPGADSFNGAYGDRVSGGADVQSMVRGAFATQVPPTGNTQAFAPQPVSQETTPIPVVVPPRTNDAVDPLAFAQSAETPAGAAASANPLYGGIVEKKATTNVSAYPGQAGNVNYDPAYGGGNRPGNP